LEPGREKFRDAEIDWGAAEWRQTAMDLCRDSRTRTSSQQSLTSRPFSPSAKRKRIDPRQGSGLAAIEIISRKTVL
jgi:hypothetical protein